MLVKLEQKGAFEYFGMECVVKDGKFSQNAVPGFWQKCHKDGSYEKLFQSLGKRAEEVGEIGFTRCPIGGICGYRDTGKNSHPYLIGAERKEGARATGYTVVEVPASTWAVFRGAISKTPAENLPGLFKEAYGRWLPSSGYDVSSDLSLEVYFSDGGGNFYEEVWIPVKKI